ncbi:MAG: DUF952 domain-containing protein [Synechococcales cyanobacterium C42_A2020_086]|nr:DUF952 domain-containing protein [Synechococcales cyanobacterium C42_A2020_086]
MPMILHITSREEWQSAQHAGMYRAASLESEGFIHCSTVPQVVRVANAFFAGQNGLVLLCLDEARLQSELRYDMIDTGEAFPHLYGPLNLDAVVQVLNFEPGRDGQFELPLALRYQE